MLVLESSLAGGRREVALAALGVLVSVMQAHGSSPLLQRCMWKRALRAMGVGVEAAASPQCMVPLQARLELVAAIGHLHVSFTSWLCTSQCKVACVLSGGCHASSSHLPCT